MEYRFSQDPLYKQFIALAAEIAAEQPVIDVALVTARVFPLENEPGSGDIWREEPIPAPDSAPAGMRAVSVRREKVTVRA